MLQMGFSQEEIQDSLVNQKYNDVMATYLLLDYRNSEVHTYTCVCAHKRRHTCVDTHYVGLDALAWKLYHTE